MHQLDGLGPQGVPEQLAVAARRLHRLIDLGQPLVVLFIKAETGIWRQRLPQAGEHRVFRRELVPGLVIRQTVLCRDQPLVAANGSVHTGEERQASRHHAGQLFLEVIQIGDDLLHCLFIEIEGRGHVIEDAEVIHDQAVGLAGINTVGAADGLQQVVILHRLVEVHHLQNRRIETGQQLGSDDQELKRVVRIAEAVEELFLLVLGQFPFRVLVGLTALGVHDDGAGLRADQLVHGLLVEYAAFTVEGHHLGLEAVRLHLLLEVLDDVLADGVHPCRGLDQHRHLGGPLGQVVTIQLAQLIGHLRVGFVDGVRFFQPTSLTAPIAGKRLYMSACI